MPQLFGNASEFFFSFYLGWGMQELRKQLEDQVVTIDKLQNENRASVVHHQTVYLYCQVSSSF